MGRLIAQSEFYLVKNVWCLTIKSGRVLAVFMTINGAVMRSIRVSFSSIKAHLRGL